MPPTLPRAWWGYHWSPPNPRSIVELIRAGTLDAELAGLLWLLVEGRVPLVVAAAPPLAGKSTLLTALLDFLPPDARPVVLAGAIEGFEWLPEAEELGWRRDLHPAYASMRGAPRHESLAGKVDASTGYLLASELSDHLPTYTWGLHARVAVRATSLGYGLGTTMHADSLAEVLDRLSAPPVSLTQDELRGLGVVLVLRVLDGEPGEADVRRRVAAAHYMRPLERDAGGHLQRRPPAVLATWDEASDSLEHFAWGVAPELAARIGMPPREFDREHAARAEYLAALAGDGVTAGPDVEAAIAGYHTGGFAATAPASAPDRHAAHGRPIQPHAHLITDGLLSRPQPLPPEAQ